MTGNVAERNAVGFENANASDSVVVAGNRFSGNRVGMTLLSSYQEAFTPQRGNDVVGNLVTRQRRGRLPRAGRGRLRDGSRSERRTEQRVRAQSDRRQPTGRRHTEQHGGPTLHSATASTDDVFEDNGVDVANISAARTPASANCAQDGADDRPRRARGAARRGLRGDDAPQAATTALAGPEAPAGISFLRVAPPRDQPNLPPRSVLSGPARSGRDARPRGVRGAGCLVPRRPLGDALTQPRARCADVLDHGEPISGVLDRVTRSAGGGPRQHPLMLAG